jgi:hypothetical protein
MFKEEGADAKKVVNMTDQKFEGVASFVLDKNFEWQRKKCWFKLYCSEHGKKHKKLGEKQHEASQYISSFDDEPVTLSITKDISISFRMSLSIADPNQHKNLFQAANAVESRDSITGAAIIDKLSITSGSVASSVANFSVADGSIANASILNFSLANASTANAIAEKGEESSGDELPSIAEDDDEIKADGEICTKDQKAQYLAMQNKSLIEIVEILELKLSKTEVDQGKINK